MTNEFEPAPETLTKPLVVQCAREIRAGGGICGVAYYLEEAFERLGYACKRFSLKELGLEPPHQRHSFLIGKLLLLRDVLIYSIFGTWKLWRQYKGKRHRVFICHNDVLYGDIYINHGLHKALIKQHAHKWRLLLRNPLHIFLLVREELRHALGLHDRIICFSQADKNDLLRYYRLSPDKIHIIPNGVDVDKFQPSVSARQEKRHDAQVHEQDFVMLFVGHVFEPKGLRHAIESLKYLPAEVRLWVLGGSAQGIDRYRRVAKRAGVLDRVRFWGVRYDTPAFFNAADVLVLPSASESWGLVGLEAMACGRPAFMTRVGGIPEYLKEGENGFFIQQDPEDIAHKVRRLLEDQALRKQIGEKARETALQFTWELIAQRYLNLIDSVLKERENNVESYLRAV